jgi:nucleoside-diphosphate-sugar epimerase
MRVLVTGATGFVGAHAVKDLLDSGQDVRVLVRSRERLATNAGAVGVDPASLDVITGDMTDEAAVRRAVSGMDAAIHAAAVVSTLSGSGAQSIVDTNVRGTQLVVGQALAAGCRQVIHVSSVAAVWSRRATVLTTDSPPALDAVSPYPRSKALAEQWVRERQAESAPVTIVYPGGLTGPPAGDAVGELAEGIVSMLKSGFVALSDGGFGIIDVRDLAHVMTTALTSGGGAPRRFMAGGAFTTLPEIGAMLRRLTGRRMPVVPAPGVVFRGLGHLVDGIRRIVPFDTVFTAEAMEVLTLAHPTDDSGVHDELGITYRDRTESIEACIRGLYASGRITSRQAGALARSEG